jgi:hypothetical protein
VPLADEIGRKKLIKLYGRDLPLGKTLVAEAVQRTKGEAQRQAAGRCERNGRWMTGALEALGQTR